MQRKNHSEDSISKRVRTTRISIPGTEVEQNLPLKLWPVRQRARQPSIPPQCPGRDNLQVFAGAKQAAFDLCREGIYPHEYECYR